tara:strand:+ start:41 stop:823 length:783 start_codon:yes stop_codon:yes gene_type:complete
MSEEVQNLAEVPEVPAPEQEATAAPESEEIQAPEVEQTESTKSFSQEELDAIVSKRLAREQRKWERDSRTRQASQPAAPRDVPPADQFESVEAYADALAMRKAEELLQQRQIQAEQSQVLEAYADREEEARTKYDDFEQVAYNPNIPITSVMAETIRASDVGPDVAYYLGSNPKDAGRISRLTPYLQAKELGKIEAKLATDPPVKKTSSAPAPIAPVTARGNNGKSLDTTDPRSIKEMSTSEWIEADRNRQRKNWEARHR